VWIGGNIKDGRARGKFFKYAESEYFLVEKSMTWERADQVCQLLGKSGKEWDLAAMLTREEFDAVATKVQELRSGSAESCQDSWINLRNYGGNWSWRGRNPRDPSGRTHSGIKKVGRSDAIWAEGQPGGSGTSTDEGKVGFIRVEGSQGKVFSSNRFRKRCSLLCKKGK